VVGEDPKVVVVVVPKVVVVGEVVPRVVAVGEAVGEVVPKDVVGEVGVPMVAYVVPFHSCLPSYHPCLPLGPSRPFVPVLPVHPSAHPFRREVEAERTSAEAFRMPGRR
jgi:hypothetical protein